MRHWAIIPAAGTGSRLRYAHSDRHVPKQYLPLLGFPLLWHSVNAFLLDARFAGVALVLGQDDEYFAQSGLQGLPGLRTVAGGATRQASVLAGLRSLETDAAPDDWVFVHDAARPCLLRSDLDCLFAELQNEAIGLVLASPVADTLKRISAAGRAQETVDRASLWRALTPQVFSYELLRRALQEAELLNEPVTDEAGAIERLSLQARLVKGRDDNLKVTQGQDLVLAECILRAQIVAGLRSSLPGC